MTSKTFLCLVAVLGCVSLIGSVETHAARTSNRLTGFKLSECRGSDCFSASGATAYISLSFDALSAGNVHFEVRSEGSVQKFECESFRFSMKTHLAMCENEKPGSTSISLNSEFELKAYR